MDRDGVERIIAFSQYPQYSCSTTGSSLNQLAQLLETNSRLELAGSNRSKNKRKISWSIIDRWSLNEGLIDSFVDLIHKGIQEKLPPELIRDDKVMLLFSAHSVPMYVVERGDSYVTEVAGTVMAIMARLSFRYPYRLVWQSKVGPLPWMSPYTDKAIEDYAKKGIRNFVVVPVAFVNEHIETLHELDIEYGKDLLKKLKGSVDNIVRIPAPNTHPAFIEGLYSEVSRHLSCRQICSPQLKVTCPHCTNHSCNRLRKWISSLENQE